MQLWRRVQNSVERKKKLNIQVDANNMINILFKSIFFYQFIIDNKLLDYNFFSQPITTFNLHPNDFVHCKTNFLKILKAVEKKGKHVNTCTNTILYSNFFGFYSIYLQRSYKFCF